MNAVNKNDPKHVLSHILNVMKKHLFFCLFYALTSHLLCAQEFKNLDFTRLCDSALTGFCHWDLSWGNINACRPDTIEGNTALLIALKSGVGWAEQQLIIEPSEDNKLIRISSLVKVENAAEKGAGLNVGIYDSEGNLLFTKDSGNYGGSGWMKGTKQWTIVRVDAVVPPGASSIKIGGILYGSGKAWFDDFEAQIESTKNRIPSALALGYISAAMDTVAKYSLRKDSVDLEAIKKYALEIAGNAKEYSDCHLAVEYILSAMEDHHSFFMNAEAVKAWEGSDANYEADIEMPSSSLINRFGYIHVPAFHGGDSVLIRKYADQLQMELSVQYHKGISGWIIDLRENTGGNMEPMIAGLGPIFDSNVLGNLVDVDGKKEAWIYDSGRYMWDEEVVLSLADPVVLEKHLPIAVLMSQRTGSSGEIVLISFIGNSDTRTFGQPSWGLTTGNGAFVLQDGSRMHLASTRMADRNGNVFFGSIKPDEYIEVSTEPNKDAVLDRASEWLTEMVSQKKGN